MKLPDVFAGLLPKKEETKEYFFSLYLDVDAVAVAAWSTDAQGKPKVASFAHTLVADDTWESRIHVIDRLLSVTEDKVGITRPITKTVFGMPGAYLTAEGNITESVRPHLKRLSQMLELTPVGFVPLSQAIAFSLKAQEGVPPSVILVGCTAGRARVSVFRVGNLTHDDLLELGDDPAGVLEVILKKHQDGDVLPSRVLLYGGNSGLLEEVRSKLLKHPWPTRANFLHFPKIEIIPLETLLTAVSLAGASELSSEIGESAEFKDAATVVAQPTTGGRAQDTGDKDDDDEDDDNDEKEGEDDEEEKKQNNDEDDTQEVVPQQMAHDAAAHGVVMNDEDEEGEDVANVKVVTPESLGFRAHDVLENVPPIADVTPSVPKTAPRPKISLPARVTLPRISFGALGNIRSVLRHLPRFRGKTPPLIIGGVIFIFLMAVLYYTVPKATVTVLVASFSVDESAAVSVDPKATVADPASKIIPGHTQEQSVSGEKTIPVTGKKNVGDPAKGTVTIYNKVTNGKILSKGTVLTTAGVAFTLDSDVSVASASETIGSITFGKATANVTARDIGPNGNVAASSEFAFAGLSSSQISARNESVFTGGTSRQVTVVSRADQDNLVEALTEDLITQAKEQLLASGSTGEQLIDATVETAVTEKVFDQEINEEVKELHGKVTITVSGVSIADSDVKAALSPLVEAKVPSGYRLAPEQTSVTTSNVSVKKDGSISLTAKLTAVALPMIDAESLRKELAGCDVDAALAILKETEGVSGAEFRFTLSPTQSRLPLNRNNITITIMVQ